MDEVSHFADLGIAYGAPSLDLDKLRAHKGKVVGKLTGGLAQMAKMRKVTVVRGAGGFLDPHHLKVDETSGEARATTGASKVVRFKQAVIAAGSQAVRLPFFPDDPRNARDPRFQQALLLKAVSDRTGTTANFDVLLDL